jgi:hypothetical protein
MGFGSPAAADDSTCVKLASHQRPAREILPPPHPNAGEPWFQSLPPERRLES